MENEASFTVDVVVYTLTGIRGWQTDIEFDASKLHCNRVTMGDFLQSFAEEHEGSTSPMSGHRDNIAGKVTSINNAIMGAIGAGGPSGTGTLCTLSFTANSDVNDVCVIAPINVILADANANEISGIVVNSGNVAIGNAQRMMSSPPTTSKPISKPSMVPKPNLAVDNGPLPADIVSPEEASKMALYYINLFSQKDFPEWIGGTTSSPTTYYAPDKTKSAYEFTALSKGQAVGYLMISARKDWSPVLELGKGPAPSSHLSEASQVAVKNNYFAQGDNSQTTLFYWGAFTYSAQIGDKMINENSVIGLESNKITKMPSKQYELKIDKSQSRAAWSSSLQAASKVTGSASSSSSSTKSAMTSSYIGPGYQTSNVIGIKPCDSNGYPLLMPAFYQQTFPPTHGDDGDGSIQWPDSRGSAADSWNSWDGCTPISGAMILKNIGRTKVFQISETFKALVVLITVILAMRRTL